VYSRMKLGPSHSKAHTSGLMYSPKQLHDKLCTVKAK
jgi:hypothetical protein